MALLIALAQTPVYLRDASAVSSLSTLWTEGDALFLVYSYDTAPAPNITGITGAGTWIKIGSVSRAFFQTLEVWYCIAPSTGSGNIVVSRDATGTANFCVFDLINVDPAITINLFGGKIYTGAPAVSFTNVTSTSNNMQSLAAAFVPIPSQFNPYVGNLINHTFLAQSGGEDVLGITLATVGIPLSGTVSSVSSQGVGDPSWASCQILLPQLRCHLPGIPGLPTITGTLPTLTIQTNTVAFATSYNLYRGTVIGGEILYKTGLSSPYFVDIVTGFGATSFYYQFTGVNTCGESDRSPEVGIVPTAPDCSWQDSECPAETTYAAGGAPPSTWQG